MTAEIRLEHVTKAYLAHQAFVIQDFSLTVQPGEFVSIVGRSGCGKTTLINLIGGFIFPSSGLITINGQRISKPSSDRVVIFQDLGLFNWKTVRQNVEFGLKAKHIKRDISRKISEDILDLVNLLDMADRFPVELSGGMRQRVALARALAINPGCILMDEPFSALDFLTKRDLLYLISQILQTIRSTVIMVTHDLDEAIYLSDRVVIMTPQPGSLYTVIDVEFQRPRMLKICETHPFITIKSHIQELLWQIENSPVKKI